MDRTEDRGLVAIVALDERMIPLNCAQANFTQNDRTAQSIAEDVFNFAPYVIGDDANNDESETETQREETFLCEEEKFSFFDDARSLDQELLHEANSQSKKIHNASDRQQVLPGNADETANLGWNVHKKNINSVCDERDAQLCLLSLPIDSLHCIASFVTASDWASFGLANTISTPICREVFRRVRMHGFLCAAEVVTAWKLDQHADARELAALYIQAGVPIYPLSLGHSYHTLLWKMGVEVLEIEQSRSDQGISETADGSAVTSIVTNQSETISQPRNVDQFFSERSTNRPPEGENVSDASYLEEKCLFCYGKAAETDSRLLAARISMTSRARFSLPARAPGNASHGVWEGRTRVPDPAESNVESAHSQQDSSSPQSLAFSDASRIPPKVRVKIHRHLVDQYLLGRQSVDDENGAMVASAVCLAADFFHPVLQGKRGLPYTPATNDANHVFSMDEIIQQNSSMSFDTTSAPVLPQVPNFEASPTDGASSDFSLLRRQNDEMTDSADLTSHQVHDVTSFVDTHPGSRTSHAFDFPFPPAAPDSETSAIGTPLQSIMIDRPTTSPPPLPVPTPEDLSSVGFIETEVPAFLSGIEIEMYSSASPNVSSLSDHRDGTRGFKDRIDFYQRRLDTLIAHNDSRGFDECMLDFWDEFLPASANIHFYDQSTAVPRVSGLHSFLTKPCPKSFGIVQCEIERIKINSKRKGVNVKGRLFPTYEYRLFIRDRRYEVRSEESASNSDDIRPPRRDTVLMMAKNRGRKHQESTGVIPASGSSKKGVNNYYLYLPEQVDVNTHFATVNNSLYSELMPNGASCAMPTRTCDISAPVLLGRLQSNFIGTEFQIFIPTLRKYPDSCQKSLIKPSIHALSSDSESDYEVSSDNAYSSSLRRNRFQRGKLLGGLGPQGHRDLANDTTSLPHPITEEESVGSPSSTVSRKHKRAYSLPNFSYRIARNSRRAVAHSVDSPTNASLQLQPVLFEEEDGAITYTANLLGNRPRIMDVCVPKVSSDGVAGSEWKKHLNSIELSSDSSVNSMLNHFKQLQQRLEHPDQNMNTDADGSEIENSDFGLLALQNRPPWWNVELGAFVLNFGGRVSVASVKNFQLCDRTDHDHIMLQFGRIQGRHSFTMDFQYPLTAVQAFAIAISSLQSKLSFG